MNCPNCGAKNKFKLTYGAAYASLNVDEVWVRCLKCDEGFSAPKRCFMVNNSYFMCSKKKYQCSIPLSYKIYKDSIVYYLYCVGCGRTYKTSILNSVKRYAHINLDFQVAMYYKSIFNKENEKLFDVNKLGVFGGKFCKTF